MSFDESTILDELLDLREEYSITEIRQDEEAGVEIEEPAENLFQMDLQHNQAHFMSKLNSPMEPVQVLNARGLPVQNREQIIPRRSSSDTNLIASNDVSNTKFPPQIANIDMETEIQLNPVVKLSDNHRRVAGVIENPITQDINQNYEHVQRMNQYLKMRLDDLKKNRRQEVLKKVEGIKFEKNTFGPNNENILDFVLEIDHLMLISKTLADPDQHMYTLQDLQEGLENLKIKFRNDDELFLKFSANIEIYFKFFQVQLEKKLSM